MRKTLTYGSFTATGIFVVILFLTAQTYIQLTTASLLYIPLVYFAYRLFHYTSHDEPVISVHEPIEEGHIIDIDKRAFLNLIGAAGLSLFLYSLFSKKGSSMLFGSSSGLGATQLQDTEGTTINPAERQPLDGFRISEIDETDFLTYYGFINKDGAWVIMRENVNSSAFRYAQGKDTFVDNWNNRQELQYDYFFNAF